MFRNTFEVKIIRVDGFNNEDVTCELYLDETLRDQFPALSQNKTILLNSKGVYKFLLKSSSFKRSVSIKTSSFKEDGAQWLPLSDSSTLLESFPEEVLPPRFLIVICRSKSLHTIEESGEISEESSLSVSESEEAISEIKIVDEIASNTCNTQEFFESIDSDFLDQSSIKEDGVEETSQIANSQRLKNIWDGDNSIENNYEKVCENCKDLAEYKRIIDEMNEKYQSIHKLGEIQQARTMDLEGIVGKYLEINKEQMKRSKEREDSLLLLVNEKENELKIAQDEVFKLRIEKQKVEIENKRLKDNIEIISSQLSLYDSSLKTQEVTFLREKVAELEKIASKSMFLNESSSSLIDKDLTIKDLQRKITQLRMNSSEKRNSDDSLDLGIDDLEDAVKLHSKKLNLVEPLIRDKEQMYIYGNRKLSLILINGNLMCRIGASFKPFKEYMETFVLDNTIIKPLNKKKFNVEENLDSEYDVQNFNEAQNKLKNASNKFNRVGLTRRRTKT